MPEPVIYVRGLSSALDIGDRFAASPQMLEDLKAIAELTEESACVIHQQLAETEGFLNPKKLLAVIQCTVSDESAAASIQRAVRSVEPKDVDPLLDALAKQDDKPGWLEDATLIRLRKILPILIDSYPALVRFEKAERLANLTGEELESIELICDLRPIFDESREKIEGMMPYTRLRLVVTGGDGLPKSFEAELTHRQVSDLTKKGKKAEMKLDALRRSVEKWLPGGLPDLPLTRPPKKESTDA